ncbi:MAG: hypothetical protein R3A48_08385 [Polyangiales bacterium]
MAALTFRRPSAVSTALTTQGQTTMTVKVQRFVAGDQGANPLFDQGNPPPPVAFEVGAETEFTLQRMGRSVATYAADLSAAEPGAAGNARQSQTIAAISQLLYWMNKWLGGPLAGQVGFKSVLQIADEANRTNKSTDLAVDVAARRLLTEVWTRGEGAGEGIDCLLGNDQMLRSLMTTAGDTPNCGLWIDRRSGLNVYHYLGIPFYRVPFPHKIIPETSEPDPTRGWLVGANLGPMGLQMVHVTGTAESRGIQLDVQPLDAAAGTVVQLVQAALTPVLWDPYGILGFDSVAYSAS